MSLPPYIIHDSGRLHRRSFLLATGSLAAAVWSSRAIGAALQRPTFSAYPFQLGVASGDPRHDSVVFQGGRKALASVA